MNAPAHGRLIGVSLGPGDPGLITRRAWDALHSGARWCYPVKRAAERSYALDIAMRAGIPCPPDAVELVFPMTRDALALGKAWGRAAERTAALLATGRDVCFLVEGDASTYATFGHLARAVRALVPTVAVETIAGVNAFAAAAARADVTLAEEDDTVAIIPAAYGVAVIDALIDQFDTLVLMKVKPLINDILDLLERRGLLATSVFVEKAGAPEERVVHALGQLRDTRVNYLSLILVHHPDRPRGPLQRGCRQRTPTHHDIAPNHDTEPA